MPKRKRLVIGEESSRLSPEILNGLEVEWLTVHVRKPSDASYIAACRSVDTLELWSWKHEDLTMLQGLAVQSLRMVRGRQRSLKGLNCSRLRFLWLQDCRHLVDFNSIRVPWLTIELCDQLRAEVGNVQGLVALDLQSKEIDSFDFLRRCPSLRRLAIGGRK